MERSNPETAQISETLADLHVHLADVRMPVSDLAGGILVVGQTSAGKTKSIVNNLARQFAEMFTANAKSIREHRQFAIFYFGLKGRGHAEFIESLSKLRAKDVITVSNDKTCPWVVRLFMKSCWRFREGLHLSVVGFVEEVAERVARTRSGYRHDPFWDRQRVLLLSELSRLEINPFLSRDLINSEVADLVHEDALIALLARAEAFLEFIGEKVTSSAQLSLAMVELREEFRQSGFATNEDLAHAEELVAFLRRRGKPGRRPKTRALCEFLYKRLQAAREAKLEAPVKTLLEQFADLLEPTSRERLRKLIARWWRIPDNTRGVIETDLRGVIQSFRSGPAEQIFRGKNKQEITIEEIIHRGLILVIDLPASDSANANWPALVALKLAITQRIIGRYTAFFDGKPLSRRGAVILQDEAQLLLSDSEAQALSVIREFGAIWILATQSISLIASVLKSDADTAAFVAAARVRIWGNTGDVYTAEMASRFCGTSRGGRQRLTSLWHPTPVLEAAVTGCSSTEKPLVEPRRFYELKTGQFYLRTADNESYFLDLRLSLPKSQSRRLQALLS